MPELLREIKKFYKEEGRGHLPWRPTSHKATKGKQNPDPYKVLVSEIMLQQTQVERVIPFYKKFLKAFPTPKILAQAPLSKVLKQWQGLGYNRRAKFLHEAAKIITREGFIGQKLPGVGPYTAGAINAFAFNKPEVFIETNIRTVFTHFCLPKKKKVSDKEILPLVEEALKKSKMQPRDFYAALMDYGTHLKEQGIKLNSRSAHYIKQSKFEGSARQKRAAHLRTLLANGASERELEKILMSK